MIEYVDFDEFEDDIEEYPMLILIVKSYNDINTKKLIKELQELLIFYPEIELGVFTVDEIDGVSNYFQTHVYPTLILYINGEEIYREVKDINIDSIEGVIIENFYLIPVEMDG